MHEFLILAPIALLLVVGLFIALQSHGETAGPGLSIHTVAENLSGLILGLMGYGVVFLALHYIVGFPVALGLE